MAQLSAPEGAYRGTYSTFGLLLRGLDINYSHACPSHSAFLQERGRDPVQGSVPPIDLGAAKSLVTTRLYSIHEYSCPSSTSCRFEMSEFSPIPQLTALVMAYPRARAGCNLRERKVLGRQVSPCPPSLLPPSCCTVDGLLFEMSSAPNA